MDSNQANDEKKIDATKAKKKQESDSDTEMEDNDETEQSIKNKINKIVDEDCEDNKFETFQKICNRIAKHSSHLEKTEILKKFFTEGIAKGELFTHT